MARKKKKKIPESTAVIKEKGPKSATTALIIAILITLILGGIPFGLGKYLEFNSPGPFDSGAFVYSAKHLLDGAKLGVDEQSSARPGTMLANVIGVKLFGFRDIGPKVVQMILQLAALSFMFYVLRKVFGTVSAVVGTTIAAIYLSAPIIAKFGNVKEQFMIPFMIIAACCFLLYGCSQKRFWLILSGFFAIQPYYFKPTGLSIVIALGFCIIVGNLIARKRKQLVLDLVLFLAGYIAGLLVPASLFIWQNMPTALFRTLPVVMLEVGAVFAVIIVGLAAIIIAIRKYNLLPYFQCVSKWIWIAGLCSIVIALTLSLILIKIEPGSVKEDIVSYLRGFPLVSISGKLYTPIETQIEKLIDAAGIQSGYVSNSWKNTTLSILAPRIFRYYKALCVPILLAIGSIITAAFLWISGLLRKTKRVPDDIQSKLVWMLAVWWVLDIGFIWGSPRSYEQYYLPMCASGAMLGGFIIWKWQKQFTQATDKIPWLIGGLIPMIVLGCLTIPIFIGQRYSPDTGSDYVKTRGARQRGFAPALKALKESRDERKKATWEAAGDYIRIHTNENDTIYVWGWVPGIYVKAQRMAPISRAFYGDMHVVSPRYLASMIDSMVEQFQKQPPKFIVDSRKQHFPNDRPPLELWPHLFSKKNPYGGEPIPNDAQAVAQYEALYKKLLTEQVDLQKKENNILLSTTGWPALRAWAKEMPDEAERYDAMKPLRDFVMQNYHIVKHYGPHVILEYNGVTQ